MAELIEVPFGGWLTWVQGIMYYMRVKVERIYSLPQGVSRLQCSLLSKFSDHLLYFIINSDLIFLVQITKDWALSGFFVWQVSILFWLTRGIICELQETTCSTLTSSPSVLDSKSQILWYFSMQSDLWCMLAEICWRGTNLMIFVYCHLLWQCVVVIYIFLSAELAVIFICLTAACNSCSWSPSPLMWQKT